MSFPSAQQLYKEHQSPDTIVDLLRHRGVTPMFQPISSLDDASSFGYSRSAATLAPPCTNRCRCCARRRKPDDD